MRRIVKIGDIVLDYPLFIKEEFGIKKSRAVAFNTVGGSKIVFESVKRDNANYITLISKSSGWQTNTTMKSVLLLLDDINVTTTITDKNGIITNVRPATETGEFIKVEDVINDAGSWLKVTIILCEV